MGSEQTAAEVFGLLSDEIRLDILRTIAVAQHEEQRTGIVELSFSELYERVEVDNTSKLSYHLGELTGTFLRKQGNGYAFTHAGEQIVRFLLAENYRSPADFEPLETEGRCLFCGATVLEAGLDGQFFMIRCADCDRPAFSYRVRPAQVRTTTGGELIETVIWEQSGDFLKMRQGVCPECTGRIDTEVVGVGDELVPDGTPVSFTTMSECQQCLRCMGIPLAYAAAYHPESVTFHWERGVDVLGTGIWESHQYLHDGRWTTERVDTDPDEYRVDMECDSATLRLYLDESARVTRTERVRQRDQGERRS